MFFDTGYFLYVLLPTMAISMLAQWYVRNAFGKWHQRRNSAGLKGSAIAERIIRRTEVGNVRFEPATRRTAAAAGVRVERGARRLWRSLRPAQPYRAALAGNGGTPLGGGHGGRRPRTGARLAA